MIICALWAFLLPADPFVHFGVENIEEEIRAAAQGLADNHAAGPSRATSSDPSAFSAEAFAAVVLWNPPPPPIGEDTGADDAVAKAVLAPPPNLTLLGIIVEADGSRRAALYDQRTDQIFIVASGEAISKGQYRITSITESAVELNAGATANGRTYRIVMKSSITKEGVIG